MLSQDELDLVSNKLTFWNNLSQFQKDLILTTAHTVHYKQNQPIYSGDNECIGVLIIKSGNIRTFITSDEGREFTLFRLESGDVCMLSASCILHDIDFDVCINAESECDVIIISSIVFSRLSSENIYVELFSYKVVTERFSDVMWAMQQILFTSFDKRLASFLIEESNRTQSIEIHMTHEQIARQLGTAREVVSRMLKYFSNEGVLQLKRGGLEITDIKKLKHLS